MISQNLNKIKRKLFGDLAGRVRTFTITPEKAVFRRKTEFGDNYLYVGYNFKDQKVTKIIYTNGEKKKILYDGKQKILDSEELKKHNLEN